MQLASVLEKRTRRVNEFAAYYKYGGKAQDADDKMNIVPVCVIHCVNFSPREFWSVFQILSGSTTVRVLTINYLWSFPLLKSALMWAIVNFFGSERNAIVGYVRFFQKRRLKYVQRIRFSEQPKNYFQALVLVFFNHYAFRFSSEDWPLKCL